MLKFEQYLTESDNVPQKLMAALAKEMGVKETDFEKVTTVGDIVKYTIKSGVKKGVYIADLNKSGNGIVKDTVEKI